ASRPTSRWPACWPPAPRDRSGFVLVALRQRELRRSRLALLQPRGPVELECDAGGGRLSGGDGHQEALGVRSHGEPRQVRPQPEQEPRRARPERRGGLHVHGENRAVDANQDHLVCRLLLEKKKTKRSQWTG